MKLILAEPRGFCAGVDRAILIVEKALEKYGAPVYVRHEIVHNAHVVNDLRQKGAIFVDEVSDIPDGAITVFSAHGVAEKVEGEALGRNLPVLDATCPLVTKVHNEGKRYAGEGYQMILIGHAGHPEVEGTAGRIPGGVLLVETTEDVQKLEVRYPDKLAYVTQTTLSVDDTRTIIDALRQRFPNIIGPDTKDICYATQNRQDAVRELAKLCDVVLVVGARNSSNSNRLRDLAEEMGTISHLINDAEDIDPTWLQNAGNVGLTAGASAPESLVQGVVTLLEHTFGASTCSLEVMKENVHFNLPRELRQSA